MHKPWVLSDHRGKETRYATKQQAMSRWGSMPDGATVEYRPSTDQKEG